MDQRGHKKTKVTTQPLRHYGTNIMKLLRFTCFPFKPPTLFPVMNKEDKEIIIQMFLTFRFLLLLILRVQVGEIDFQVDFSELEKGIDELYKKLDNWKKV